MMKNDEKRQLLKDIFEFYLAELKSAYREVNGDISVKYFNKAKRQAFLDGIPIKEGYIYLAILSAEINFLNERKEIVLKIAEEIDRALENEPCLSLGVVPVSPKDRPG